MNSHRFSTRRARSTIAESSISHVQGDDMSEVMEAPSKAIDLKGRTSIYQPEQQGLIFPELPAFGSHAQRRQHQKERLVGACRAFALREHVGSEYIGWLHFQTIWNDLVNTQPDMFD
jgi:hypothetical protein